MLEIINELSNIKSPYRNQLCFYALRTKYLKRNQRNSALITVSTTVKYWRINISKKVKNLNNETTMLMK